MDDVPGTPPPTPSSSSSIDCGEGDESLHPWPYLGSMFTFIGQKDNSYRMKCQLCLPKDCEILAFKNSPSNLKKHIKSKHDCHLKKYKDLTSLKRKRKTATPTPSSSSIKQPTLDSWTAPHRSVDKAIVNYVVRGLQPFSIVEQEHFRDFVFDLVPNAKIMSRNTLTSRIEDAAKQMKIKIIESMKNVDYIATTTDCWSVRRRGFIGVTAHWLNHDSLKRVSVALACKRLRGSHTFDRLANALNDIHTEFEIRGKIVRTTTDNGSNLIKAFKVFAEEENDNAGAQVQEEEAEETDQDEEEVEFVDVSSLLDEDDSFEFQRCACHILNLIATTDAHKAVSNDSYKKLYYSTFGKCSALWNKWSRSSTAAETVDASSLQLVRPVATRWNSVFMAVERLLRIVKEKGEAAMKVICTGLNVPMFNPAELAFLSEFAVVMTPVAQATNILQAETNVQMGWLLPTVKLLIIKLDRIKLRLKYCKPLVDALQVGIEERFGPMMQDPELVAAAILLPKFRTNWTRDEETIKLGVDYIKRHIEDFSL